MLNQMKKYLRILSNKEINVSVTIQYLPDLRNSQFYVKDPAPKICITESYTVVENELKAIEEQLNQGF